MHNEDGKPPKKKPKRQMPQIAIRLPPDQIEELDEIVNASRGRHNRSDLIRLAIDQYLQQRHKGQ